MNCFPRSLSISFTEQFRAYKVIVFILFNIKSQGQSLDAALVDLSNCFTPGLGYVALSRVSNMDDLIITNINNKAYAIDKSSQEAMKKVRRAALKHRAEFIENIDVYEGLLTMPMARMMFWNESDGGSIKLSFS